ncbi:MAG: SAM-dependent methyltransferase [Pirellulales bacterium]|nr:SAM-dependent methyltransferase [Pirellulales bacterium]
MTFLYVTCQVGAERAVKGEMSRRHADARPAFARPGFLTFKLPSSQELADDLKLRCAFARSHGFSLGPVRGTDPESMAAEAWKLVGERSCRRIHVWPRDAASPGERGFEPRITEECLQIKEVLRQTCPRPGELAVSDADSRAAAERGDAVLDCILMDPGEWWVGFHRARSFASRWPGGMMPLELPTNAVSRAWLKMEEALRWSRLPIPSGARVAEIGSAPGGASQALLARGFWVTGIDPAAMAPVVLEHPRFRHIRRRAVQVRRREFRKIRWLTADMNVAPKYTLDVVEGIVAHRETRIRGMLLTLKLFDWNLAERLPEYVDRVRSWGYDLVRARQLQHNHREVCLAVMRRGKSAGRRPNGKRSSPRTPKPQSDSDL